MTKRLTILLVSAWVGTPASWLSDVQENHQLYAKRHDYLTMFDVTDSLGDSTPRPANRFSTRSGNPPDAAIMSVWRQIEVVRTALKDTSVDYVFKSDCDSLFMDLSVDLADLVDRKEDFIFTGDAWDLFNGGHFLIRNTARAREFLDYWLSFRRVLGTQLPTAHQSESGILSDQPAMNIILGSGKHIVEEDIPEAFNKVNGFRGNRSRVHRWFPYTHAPTRVWRLGISKTLIHPDWAETVAIVEQNRMNSYPARLPGARPYRRGDPILHFVRDKDQIPLYAKLARSEHS